MSTERQRGFEVVDNKHKKYDGRLKIKLPVRKTHHSAGYDFSTPVSITLPPKQSVLVWTEVKAYMKSDEALKLHIRSSLGNMGLQLRNLTGIIDSDYYSNIDNDGNIGLKLYNDSNEMIKFTRGESIAQGIFQKYLTVDDDETYDKETREGGYGSTNKGDE